MDTEVPVDDVVLMLVGTLSGVSPNEIFAVAVEDS